MEDIIFKERKFYNVKDIQNILGIGRSRAYEYLKGHQMTGAPFIVIVLGTIYKLPIQSFTNWIPSMSE